MIEAERLASIRQARTKRDRAELDLERLMLEAVEAGDNRRSIAEAAGLTRSGLYWIINNRRGNAA